MLNEASRRGIAEILSDLDESTLSSLAGTVTNGLLRNRLQSREEAVTAILNYSPDVSSVLKRKVITKEILFAYSHKNHLTLEAPPTKNTLIEKITAFWSENIPSETTTATTIDTGSVSCLAEQFSKWFYTMLNSAEFVTAEHFYADATLNLNIASEMETLSETVNNSGREIVERLRAAKSQFNLFFNPGGVYGQLDPHGLVLVRVQGTLHSSDNCVGIFEQAFALIRDPTATNNWKIKKTELTLRSQAVAAIAN